MIRKEDILKLTDAERLLILEEIWNAIDHKNIKTPPSHKDELEKRLARFRAGQTKFFTWEQVKKDLHNS